MVIHQRCGLWEEFSTTTIDTARGRVVIRKLQVAMPRNLVALTNAVITAFRLAGLENIREAALELHASHQLIRQVLEAV